MFLVQINLIVFRNMSVSVFLDVMETDFIFFPVKTDKIQGNINLESVSDH